MTEPHMIGEWSCGVGTHGQRFAFCRTSSIEYRSDGALRTRGWCPPEVLAWILQTTPASMQDRMRETVMAYDFEGKQLHQVVKP